MMRPFVTTALLLALPLAACHSRGSAAPLLASLTPQQVSIAGGNSVTVTVRGHGFDSLNTVHFGELRIPGVPRTNDSVMQLAVPTDNTYLPNRGAAPVQPLASGRYDVRVETRRGTSNALTLMVSNGGVR